MVIVRKPMPSVSQQETVVKEKPEDVPREIIADGVRALRTPHRPGPRHVSQPSLVRETAKELAARIRAISRPAVTGQGSADSHPVHASTRRTFRFRPYR